MTEKSDDEYVVALRKRAPDMAGAFARAHSPTEKEVKVPERKAELKPPGASPMGDEAPPAQVSPQLREEYPREQEKRAIMASMRVRREFNRVSRDAIER